MPTPLHTAAYPLVMLDAITRVCANGQPLEIPTKTPVRTRLQFHGLKAALRREGKPELADPWAISIPKDEPPRIVIYLRENSELASEVALALSHIVKPKPRVEPTPEDDSIFFPPAPPVITPESAENAFNRIMGITK